MTVPAQDRFTFSSGNGVTTTFPYTFMIPGTVDDPQFLVYLIEIATGTRTDLTVDVDYSISGLGVEEGGVVTYPLSGTPLPATHRLVIESNMPYEQQTDVYNSGTLYLSAIEDQFDNTTRQVQQIQDRVNRTFSVGIGYEGNYELFPAADKLIGWNSTGTGLENKQSESESAAAAYAAQLAAEAAAAAVVGIVSSFGSKALAEAATYPEVPPAFITLTGYYAPGDGGGALYANPVTVDPARPDTLQISIGGVPTWLTRVHLDGINMLQHGMKGDGTDESALFRECLTLAELTGHRKIVNKDASRSFKLVEIELVNDIEFDIAGWVLGDFGPWGLSTVDGTPINWTKNVLFSEETNAPSVKFTKFHVNGQNDPGVVMAGGTPLIFLRGPNAAPTLGTRGLCRCTFGDFVMTRGSNRIYTTGSGITSPTLKLDGRNSEILLYNFDVVEGYGTVEVRSSPGEMMCIQSDDARTLIWLRHFKGRKTRDQNSTQRWSSSSLNIFNCHPASRIDIFEAYDHNKGAINIETDGFFIDTAIIDGVADSNGIDCCEANSMRQNMFRFNNLYLKDIVNAGVRIAASNCKIGHVFLERVNVGILARSNIVPFDPSQGTWVKGDTKPLYGIDVEHIHVVAFDASHSTLAIAEFVGAYAANPVHATIRNVSTADRPGAENLKPLHSIKMTNAHVKVMGYLSEGRTSLVQWNGGEGSLIFEDVTFAPEPGMATHCVELVNAVLGPRSLIFERCKRVTTVDVGNYDIRNTTSTIDLDAIHVNNSPKFPATTNNAVIARNGLLTGTLVYNPPSLADGDAAEANVTVTGARIGDEVSASFGASIQGVTMTAYIAASNTVTVRFQNETGALVDIISSTITAFVRKREVVSAP